MTVTTLVRADRLFLCSKFQSKEVTRYCLNGVFLDICEAGGVKLVATDGHRMGIFRDKIGYTGRSLIVALPRVLRAAYGGLPRSQRENTWFGIIDYPSQGHIGRPLAALWTTSAPGFIDDDLFPQITEDMQDPTNMNVVWFGVVEIIDGEYPNYRKVVPASRPLVSEMPGYQLRYLKGFAEIAEASSSSNDCKVMGAGDAEPAYVDVGRDDFVGIIMSMHFDVRCIEQRSTGFHAPSWIFDGVHQTQNKPAEAPASPQPEPPELG